MVSLAASSAPGRDREPGLGRAETAPLRRRWLPSDGAAPTVSVPTLSKEVARFLSAGGGFNRVLLSSTDFRSF